MTGPQIQAPWPLWARSCGIGRRLAGDHPGLRPWARDRGDRDGADQTVDAPDVALPVHAAGQVSFSFRIVDGSDGDRAGAADDGTGCWRTVEDGRACGRPSDPGSPTGMCEEHSRELRDAPVGAGD